MQHHLTVLPSDSSWADLGPTNPDRVALVTETVKAYRHPGWHAKVRRALDGVPGDYEVAVSRLLPHGLVLECGHRFGLPRGEHLFGETDVFHGTLNTQSIRGVMGNTGVADSSPRRTRST